MDLLGRYNPGSLTAAQMKRFLPVLLLALLPSCEFLIIPAASAAAGAWSYHEYSNESGEIILAGTADDVFRAAESVARARGTNVESLYASKRILFDIEPSSVKIQVIMIPNVEGVVQLRVSAWELVRGRADLAKEIAEDIRVRL